MEKKGHANTGTGISTGIVKAEKGEGKSGHSNLIPNEWYRRHRVGATGIQAQDFS